MKTAREHVKPWLQNTAIPATRILLVPRLLSGGLTFYYFQSGNE